jgi:hypothetical protein
MGFNGEPIFQPVKYKSCNYAKMLMQLEKMQMKCGLALYGMTT